MRLTEEQQKDFYRIIGFFEREHNKISEKYENRQEVYNKPTGGRVREIRRIARRFSSERG